MSNVKSCLLVGVGGQGAILISKIMSNGFMKAGYDVKQSEVHGMAQRGGSVSTQVRWGDKVYGPVFGRGEADIMVALEKMEAVRSIPRAASRPCRRTSTPSPSPPARSLSISATPSA